MHLLLIGLMLTTTQPSSSTTPGRDTATAPVRASASFPVEYDAPENPAHAQLYAMARQGRVLEALSQYLSPIRMPRPLKLKLKGCDGEANAWYDNETRSVTFCYDFIDDFVKNAPGAREKGVAFDEAVVGPFTFFFMHEIGHALIDQLNLPVLGREEDAADRFAAFVLLHAGKDAALPTLRGTAWAFHHDARERNPEESDFSDVHGLDAQRYYDVLCLAYGSDPVVYKGALEKAGLPVDRAEGCADEWRQVNNSYRTVLAKYVDPKRYKKVREAQVARLKARRTLQPTDFQARPEAAPKPNP